MADVSSKGAFERGHFSYLPMVVSCDHEAGPSEIFCDFSSCRLNLHLKRNLHLLLNLHLKLNLRLRVNLHLRLNLRLRLNLHLLSQQRNPQKAKSMWRQRQRLAKGTGEI